MRERDLFGRNETADYEEVERERRLWEEEMFIQESDELIESFKELVKQGLVKES